MLHFLRLPSLRENLLSFRNPDCLHTFHDKFLHMESINDLLGIRETLACHPIESTVHVEGDLRDSHPVCHREICAELSHDFGCLCSFHERNELPRVLVREDGEELSPDEGSLINRESLPHVFRVEEFLGSQGLIIS